MKRLFIVAAALSCHATQTVVAQQFVYDFGGVLGDHFVEALTSPGTAITQNDALGRLEYSAPGGQLLPENVAALSHVQFTPRYDETWRAAVDVALPARYDNSFLTSNPANQDPDGDSWMEVGILAFSDLDADELFVMTLALEPAGPNRVDRIFLADDESADTGSAVNTADLTARLSISFDPAAETLTAYAGANAIFSADVGPGGSDWGMSAADTFGIVLFGSTGYQEVLASEPFTHDNFVGEIVAAPNLPGDYNNDGVVGTADFTAWRDAVGAPIGALANDFDGGVTAAAQYLTWRQNFGRLPGSAGATIPAPATTAMLLAFGAVLLLNRPARD